MQALLQKRIDVLDLEQQANVAVSCTGDNANAFRFAVALSGGIFELLQLARHLGVKVTYRRPLPSDPQEDVLYPSSSVYELAKKDPT
jgi:hypothetical protein